jgi:branched-chain amino acid aminotransferase
MSYKIKVKLTDNSRLQSLDFTNIPFGKTFSDHMFVVDYSDGEWRDPQIVPFGYMPLHPANLAIHYGQSLFEGMKASKMEDGTPALFRTDMHVKRLNASARRLCMPELPGALFKEALEMLVDIDRDWIPPMEGSTLYIRPFMYATDEFLGVRPSETYKFVIISGPVGPYYSKPVTLWAETEYIRAAQGGTGEAKAAGNYAGALLPTKLANQRGFDQILWLDAVEHKYVQEAGTMNLMFVIDGKVITAPIDGTILRGITRNTMLILLKDNGYTVEERPLSMDEIVVSHVASVTHGDLTMNLPPVETRKVGIWLKNQIDKMRTGAIVDKYGWVEPIGVGELV